MGIKMRVHIVVYIVFVVSILFDLATTVLGLRLGGVAETNLLYRIVGPWAFLIVYLIDAVFLLAVEWLRKTIRWSPLILFILILAYVGAGLINLQLITGWGEGAATTTFSPISLLGKSRLSRSRRVVGSNSQAACTAPPVHLRECSPWS